MCPCTGLTPVSPYLSCKGEPTTSHTFSFNSWVERKDHLPQHGGNVFLNEAQYTIEPFLLQGYIAGSQSASCPPDLLSFSSDLNLYLFTYLYLFNLLLRELHQDTESPLKTRWETWTWDLLETQDLVCWRCLWRTYMERMCLNEDVLHLFLCVSTHIH